MYPYDKIRLRKDVAHAPYAEGFILDNSNRNITLKMSHSILHIPDNAIGKISDAKDGRESDATTLYLKSDAKFTQKIIIDEEKIIDAITADYFNYIWEGLPQEEQSCLRLDCAHDCAIQCGGDCDYTVTQCGDCACTYNPKKRK